MKKSKKQNGFHKKSVWPSIMLFFTFLAICVWLLTVFLRVFEAYWEESRIASIYNDAEQLGRILSAHMENSNLLEAASAAGQYLDPQNDLCVTDREGQILMQFGTTTPDFDRVEMVELLDVYQIYADSSTETMEYENQFFLARFWKQALKMPPADRRKDKNWLKEILFSVYCWVEIPMRTEEYHLYYKAPISLARQDVLYAFATCAMAVPALLVPIILLFINVLSSISMQKRMVRLLYLDSATGGKNWVYFLHRSKKILCRFWNAHKTYIIVNLHLDRYQDYCVCYGSSAGEELLKNINGFLEARTGRGESFARFAKADFGLLLQCDSEEQCRKRLKKMMADLTGIQRESRLKFHMGLYIIDPVSNQKGDNAQQRRQIDIDRLYHCADVARETLDGKDGQYIQIFDQQILEEQLWKRKVEDTMEMALINREFQIYLQPKYNPLSGKIVGAEALVRWLSPENGLIMPGRFIPIFEENGFITRLDDYMISSVARLQSERKLQGKKPIPISVNVSRANFTKEDLAEHICHLVDGYGADHAGIELEVTESAFFGNKDMLQKTIRKLKMYGFRISMDDFGAGYSSLNSLKDLPIDVLKLDMEFFRGETMERRGEIVVRETIRLAKDLDMKIVAEGIERKEQVEFLAEQGCDMIQGYYYAKPMPVKEFDEKAEQNG